MTVVNSGEPRESTYDYEDPFLDSIVIPDCVANYTPTGDLVHTVTKSNYKVRYIFSNVEFTEFERNHIEGFKAYVVKQLDGSALSLPDAIACFDKKFANTIFADDGYVLRFIIGNDYAYPESLDDIRSHLIWRKNTLPIRRVEVETEIARGFVYIHGRDKCFRPMVILRLGKTEKLTHEMVLRTIFFWLEFTIHKLLVPGKVEQWKVIVDLAGINIFSVPVSLIKQISKALTINYRGRLSQMFIIHAPYLLTGIWNVVKTVLPQVTQEKISISSGKNSKKLVEIIDPSQLEVRYGGTAPNTTMFDLPVLPEMF